MNSPSLRLASLYLSAVVALCGEFVLPAAVAAQTPADKEALPRAPAPQSAAPDRPVPAPKPGTAATPQPTPPADPLIPRELLQNPRRHAALGRWQPLLLPPNDLTDPPVRYPGCSGGACLGMSAVIYGLWCSPTENTIRTLHETAAALVHNMVPDPRGDFTTFRLPATVRFEDGSTLPLTAPATLVRLAEHVQQKTMPGGAAERTPRQVRQLFNFLINHRGRLTTAAALREHLAAAGGRAVVALFNFTQDVTRYEGHAVILTLDRQQRILVWDPNARMTAGTPGSDRPAPVTVQHKPDGRLARLSYTITLPDGTSQQRQFTHAFKLAPLIEAATLPQR